MYIKDLIASGLSEHEAKIYYALLKFGDAGASALAKRTEIGRTNVYDYLTSLINKGLVTEMEKNSRRYFTAEDPKLLEEIVNEQVRKSKDAANSIGRLMTGLTEMYYSNTSKPIVKVFSGLNGYDAVYKKIFNITKLDHIYHLIPDLDNYALPDPKFHNHLLREQVFTFLIANRGNNLLELNKRDARMLRSTVILPSPIFEIASEMIIFADQLVLGNLQKNEFFASYLKNFELVNMLKSLLKQQISAVN
ncbi:MAG: helix-turn-helix domain-containing protein [bacterium]